MVLFLDGRGLAPSSGSFAPALAWKGFFMAQARGGRVG